MASAGKGAKWPLKPVLRVRELELEREEQALAHIHAEIARAQAARSNAARDLQQLAAARNQLLERAPLSSVHLRSLAANSEAQRERMRALDEELIVLGGKRAAQLERHKLAQQRCELMLVLRDAHAAQRAAFLAKSEQGAADEAFLATHFARQPR